MTTLDEFTQEYLTQSMLSRVPDTIDKREGSIIYDTIAPTAVELATYYVNLKEVQKQAYASTATGAFLDLIVAEAGVSRYSASYAQKLVTFKDDSGNPVAVPIGNRFSTISTDVPINYAITSVYTNVNGVVVAGSYVATCETLGSVGNGYTGNILPITFLSGLTTAVMADTLLPADDEEDDETLRARYFSRLSQKAFGGNVAQYNEWLDAIVGIGEAQVYPVWNGGGTVKCSIIDTSFNPCSQAFVNNVQNQLDPLTINGVATSGQGIGYAPIGHQVTVTTPTEFPITFYAKISLIGNYSLATATTNITNALNNYMNTLRKNWGVGDSLNKYSANVYYAKALSVVMGCDGVANVSLLTLNGSSSDIILTQSGTLQQLPKLNSIQITI